MSFPKRVLLLFLLLLLIVSAAYFWFVILNHRFTAISDGKVYRSGRMPPRQLKAYILRHQIRTVIDLRDPGIQDHLNPAIQSEIDEEMAVISTMGGVVYVNIPSPQVPTGRTLTQFFRILDDKESYPVLIHCHHGTGRAVIYSALYKIEYEGISTEQARLMTRFLVQGFGYHSSFANEREKGEFLATYIPRIEGKNSTLAKLNR